MFPQGLQIRLTSEVLEVQFENSKIFETLHKRSSCDANNGIIFLPAGKQS